MLCLTGLGFGAVEISSEDRMLKLHNGADYTCSRAARVADDSTAGWCDIRFSFQVQRMEQLVVVPLFPLSRRKPAGFRSTLVFKRRQNFPVCSGVEGTCSRVDGAANVGTVDRRGNCQPPDLEDFLGTVFNQLSLLNKTSKIFPRALRFH